MLHAHQVGLKIGRKVLLDNVDLLVLPGEVTAIVGPNGAGKSTLLKLLCGDAKPSSGQISLNGQDLSDWPLKTLAKIRAVQPQETRISFPFTAREVVTIGRSPHCGTYETEKDRLIVERAMAECDVAHLAGRSYPSLSGGERQRVQLARALAQIWEPQEDQQRYLLLDEPTSALDMAHQHQALGLARRFAQREQVGVLVVLHDLNLAALYSDQIALMAEARMVACGNPQTVLRADLLEEVFSIPVHIQPHPQRNIPIVTSLPPDGAAFDGDTFHDHRRPVAVLSH